MLRDTRRHGTEWPTTVRRRWTTRPWVLPVVTAATLAVTLGAYIFFPDLYFVDARHTGLPIWWVGLYFLLLFLWGVILTVFPALKRYWLVPAVLYLVVILTTMYQAIRQCPPPLRFIANCPVIVSEEDPDIGDNRPPRRPLAPAQPDDSSPR